MQECVWECMCECVYVSTSDVSSFEEVYLQQSVGVCELHSLILPYNFKLCWGEWSLFFWGGGGGGRSKLFQVCVSLALLSLTLRGSPAAVIRQRSSPHTSQHLPVSLLHL